MRTITKRPMRELRDGPLELLPTELLLAIGRMTLRGAQQNLRLRSRRWCCGYHCYVWLDWADMVADNLLEDRIEQLRLFPAREVA